MNAFSVNTSSQNPMKNLDKTFDTMRRTKPTKKFRFRRHSIGYVEETANVENVSDQLILLDYNPRIKFNKSFLLNQTSTVKKHTFTLPKPMSNCNRAVLSSKSISNLSTSGSSSLLSAVVKQPQSRKHQPIPTVFNISPLSMSISSCSNSSNISNQVVKNIADEVGSITSSSAVNIVHDEYMNKHHESFLLANANNLKFNFTFESLI